MADDGDRPMRLSEVLERMSRQGGAERVSLGDLLGAFGGRAFGPLLLIPALIALVPPVGAIPGMSIATGSIIALVAVQMLFNLNHPWLPGRLLRVSFDRDRFETALRWLYPRARRVERFVRPRWMVLLQPPFAQGVAVLCIVLAAAMYPLALVPFGVSLPSLALVFLALGVTARDGLVLAIGLAIAAGAAGAAYVTLI